ncbi:PepSY domain-containing protein [Methanobacterium paludis]|uniref:PepSY domain-containing protein n=1 Tax=Methanobacterium paludis (strain DSM 25820 / JCM 18151 / SWAN1) TaxID=868131 RepID=F6D7H2_METPW|nr:PepSY domain-containing protein [Methanobacterium paludis]AEG17754.1 hypothetical protein MSWAN_0720 [Methanobacterium paludis]
MDNKVKILLIIIFVFVAVIGLVGGFILEGYLQDNDKNTSVLDNNSSIDVTTNISTDNNETQQKSSDSGFISPQEAIKVAKETAGPSSNVRYEAKLIQNGQNPYYLITVYDTKINSTTYGVAIGGAKVDAKTGQFLEGMG